MYIPGGVIGSQIIILSYILMALIWYKTYKKLKNRYNIDIIKKIFLGAAFALILLMADIPFTGELPGNITGAVLLSILYGPWVSSVMISLAVLIKIVLLGNGDISIFAVNSFIMAYVTSFSGYFVFKFINSKLPVSLNINLSPAGIGAYISSVSAAIMTSLFLIFQTMLDYSAFGETFKINNYLENIIIMLFLKHIFIIGLFEAGMTIMGITLLTQSENYLLNLILGKKEAPVRETRLIPAGNYQKPTPVT